MDNYSDDAKKRKELYEKAVLNFEENGYSQYPGDRNSFERKFLVDGKVFRVTVSCRFIIFDKKSHIHSDFYVNDRFVFSSSYSEEFEKNICSDIENNIVYFWLHSFEKIFDHMVRYKNISSGNGIVIRGLDFMHFGFVEIQNIKDVSPKQALNYILKVISNRKMLEE